jgi:hypothetical protein
MRRIPDEFTLWLAARLYCGGKPGLQRLRRGQSPRLKAAVTLPAWRVWLRELRSNSRAYNQAAQGIAAEIPQQPHGRLRGIGAESLLFCGLPQKMRPWPDLKKVYAATLAAIRLSLFFVCRDDIVEVSCYFPNGEGDAP